MPIPVTCSQCGHVLSAPDHAAGRTGNCPQCGAQIQVPAPQFREGGPGPRGGMFASGMRPAVTPQAIGGDDPSASWVHHPKSAGDLTVQDHGGDGQAAWGGLRAEGSGVDEASPAPRTTPGAGPILAKLVSISVRCECNTIIAAPLHAAGKTGKCPQCGQGVLIPEVQILDVG